MRCILGDILLVKLNLRHISGGRSAPVFLTIFKTIIHVICILVTAQTEKFTFPGKTKWTCAGAHGLLTCDIIKVNQHFCVVLANSIRFHFQVNVKIETELTCLQAQMKFAPSEAKEKAVHEMLQKTILWLAARQENGIPIGPVDYYARNVWQILREEAMTELPEQEKRPEIKYVFYTSFTPAEGG